MEPHLGGLSGRALEGGKLEIIPSMMTNWRNWSQRYPDTTVTMLPPTAQVFRSDLLKNGRKFGIGLSRMGMSRFWRFDLLESQALANDHLDIPLVVFFDHANHTPMVWDRRLDGDVLTFRASPTGVEDVRTHSQWDLISGKATKGPSAGKQLKPLPAIVSFRNAWRRFHPESTYWQPN